MLSWNDVIKYIRNRLALPSNFLEKSDEEIKEYLIDNALTEFSNFFPDVNRVTISTSDPKTRHPKLKNCYLIIDPDNLTIFGIKECLFPLEDLAFLGHPIVSPTSLEGMAGWSLNVFRSRTVYSYSIVSKLYKFIPPNVVEISSEIQPEYFTVEYERMQPPDLSKIPPAMIQKFKDFCFAHCLIWIGSIRALYTNLSTPYGEIPIAGVELQSKGEELRERILDEFREDSRPPIIIDTY